VEIELIRFILFLIIWISGISLIFLKIFLRKKDNKRIALFKKYVTGWNYKPDKLTFLVLAAFVIVIYAFSMNVGVTHQDINLVMDVILSPIFEEVLFRGLILGAFITVAVWVMKKYTDEKFYPYILAGSIYMIGLIIQGYVFMHGHMKGVDGTLFADSLIYGIAFTLSRRNILPPIAAHITVNFLVYSKII